MHQRLRDQTKKKTSYDDKTKNRDFNARAGKKSYVKKTLRQGRGMNVANYHFHRVCDMRIMKAFFQKREGRM